MIQKDTLESWLKVTRTRYSACPIDMDDGTTKNLVLSANHVGQIQVTLGTTPLYVGSDAGEAARVYNDQLRDNLLRKEARMHKSILEPK